MNEPDKFDHEEVTCESMWETIHDTLSPGEPRYCCVCIGHKCPEALAEISRVKTKAAADLVAKVFAGSSVGGNAHIVVDDRNLDDDSIRWCVDVGLAQNAHQSTEEELAAERACLEALLALTADEREAALALADDIKG